MHSKIDPINFPSISKYRNDILAHDLMIFSPMTNCYAFLFLLSSISVINLIMLSFLSFIDTASTWQFCFCYLSYQLPVIDDSSFWPCINTISSYFETVARFCLIKSYLNSNLLKPARQTSWRTRILVWLKNTTNDCRQLDYSCLKS